MPDVLEPLNQQQQLPNFRILVLLKYINPICLSYCKSSFLLRTAKCIPNQYKCLRCTEPGQAREVDFTRVGRNCQQHKMPEITEEGEIQNINNKNRDKIGVPQFPHRGVKSIIQESACESGL